MNRSVLNCTCSVKYINQEKNVNKIHVQVVGGGLFVHIQASNILKKIPTVPMRQTQINVSHKCDTRAR